MINKNDEISFLTDEDGKETPIQVLKEFDREDGKRFVIYSDIEDPTENQEKEFYVAEIVTLEDGSQELAEVESEEDMAYCQEVFDTLIDELMSMEMSDEDLNEEDDSDVIVS